MLFSSLVFLTGFLPIVIFLYYTIFRFNRSVQNVFLLLISLFFYGWGEPGFVFVLLCSVVVNWGFGLLVDRIRQDRLKSRITIGLMVAYNISIIFVFKYLVFVMKNINAITGKSLSIPDIALPIGISFFTFQAISYVIDIYRQKGEVQRNPLNVGLYIAFFPQLVAGPIVRYETVAHQIQHRKESIELFSEGVCRFIVGLAKKIIIANNVAIVANSAFWLNGENTLSISMAWLGALCYTLQIYYDFSGYSDMAIGLGKMFGFNFNENFNYPYISKSTTEFWRRWHISLGTWFRDYVYIPLGGSRVSSSARLYMNTFVVWLLTGIWHGANWTFICWGLMYFVSISLEKAVGLDRMENFRWIRHIYTMLLVMFGWVIFRANTITEAGSYLKAMIVPVRGYIFDSEAYMYICEYWFFIAVGILFARPIAKKLGRADISKGRVAGVIYVMAMMVLLIISISYLVKGAYNPFIYFNF